MNDSHDSITSARSAGKKTNYDDAIKSIQHAVDKYKSCTDEEKEHLKKDLSQLRDMEQKLSQGRVEIVLFGEISTGKSALINALVGEDVAEINVQGGWTKESRPVKWHEQEYVLPGLDDSQLVIVDTPGINEVGDSDHEAIAQHAAKRGDVILFVTDSDLNEVEFSAIVALAAIHKPIIIVLNKIDLYEEQELQQLVRVLRNERLKDIIPTSDIICTAADPREVEYVHIDEHGNERCEWRKPKPIIAELKARILEILERDGLALVALNAAMYAADKTDRIAQIRIEIRNQQAQKTIWGFAAVKALTVALNPLPFVDTVGGLAVDVTMLLSLGKVYGIQLTRTNAQKLAWSVLKATGWVAVSEWAMHGICGLLKAGSFGASTAISAVPQSAAAGYASYIVGQAAKYYFEHGASWGKEAPKQVVRRILNETDRDSVLEQLKDEISKKLPFNFYAKEESKRET